jgi:hypothetical protein
MYDRYIQFTKQGCFFASHYGKKEKVHSLIPYLQDKIAIEEGVLLRDIWGLIEADKEIYNQIFKSALGGYSLDAYVEEAHKKPLSEKENSEEGIRELRLSWDNVLISEIAEDGESESIGEISDTMIFSGWGPISELNGECGPWSLMFSPINDIIDYPVFVDNTIVMHIIDKDPQTLAYCTPTVYHVINAILYEISFMGDPETRDKESKELLETLKEREKEIQNGDLSEFRTWEEIEEDLKGLE